MRWRSASGVLCLAVLLTPATALAQDRVLAPRDSALVADYLRVLEAKFLRRDQRPLELLADTAYVVVTPGGILETRTLALRGIQNFRLDSATLTNPQVLRDGDLAILTAELRLVGALEARSPGGAIRRVELTGPYRVLATFVAAPGVPARLLAESVTPVRAPGAPTTIPPRP